MKERTRKKLSLDQKELKNFCFYFCDFSGVNVTQTLPFGYCLSLALKIVTQLIFNDDFCPILFDVLLDSDLLIIVANITNITKKLN